MKSVFSYIRFPGRRWLWCSRTMMLGPAAFSKVVRGNVAEMFFKITVLRKNSPGNFQVDQTNCPLGTTARMTSLFSWSSQLQENRWESFPTPSRRFKKERAEGGLHRFHPPILWFGINPFKKNRKKIKVSHHQHRPKPIISDGPVDRKSQGVLGENQVEDADVFFVFWLGDFVFLLPNSTWYGMKDIGISSLAKKEETSSTRNIIQV